MIVFVSNFYNHHQSYLSEALYKITNGEYRFIAVSEIDDERRRMGWNSRSDSFVMSLTAEPKECCKLIDGAEVVIYGSAPETLFKTRLLHKKLTFKYSERPYKKKIKWYMVPLRHFVNYQKWGRHKSLYLLSASAYSYSDYMITNTFKNKGYRWGYFPETRHYEDNILLKEKDYNNKIRLLWVGRLLDWKHPEAVVRLAKRLKANGFDFSVTMIGVGEEEEELKRAIADNQLNDCISLLGPMSPHSVRAYMEKANIYLFTSDRNEGWGAVVNEAMNSGCAIVASRAAGSVPFLIKHGKNGYIYDTDEELYKFVENLITDNKLREEFGKAAYETIINDWNSDIAAERLLKLVDEIQKHGKCDLYTTGPCSKDTVYTGEN